MSTVFIKFFQCTFIFTWVVLKCDTRLQNKSSPVNFEFGKRRYDFRVSIYTGVSLKGLNIYYIGILHRYERFTCQRFTHANASRVNVSRVTHTYINTSRVNYVSRYTFTRVNASHVNVSRVNHTRVNTSCGNVSRVIALQCPQWAGPFLYKQPLPTSRAEPTLIFWWRDGERFTSFSPIQRHEPK